MRHRSVSMLTLLIALLCSSAHGGLGQSPRLARKARNVVLMVGDGLGLSTVNAASIYGHKRSGALFIQRLPHLGFSDTSSANNWVTDSAAGMTALITGTNTFNGVSVTASM